VKAALLGIVADAVAAGWTTARVSGVLEIDRGRLWRWQQRAAEGTLADRPPGGNPIHRLLDWEEEAIVDLYNTWGPVDLSHRKLAHRGSYTDTVWVSPSTVDRVLARNGLSLKGALLHWAAPADPAHQKGRESRLEIHRGTPRAMLLTFG
jgi:hypothetical protein